MGYINHCCVIVKVLEKPFQTFVKDQIPLTVVRAELPQSRNKQLIILQFWGNLARNIENYYQLNDYVLIEGYISTRNKTSKNLPKINSKSVMLTVLKVYPLILKGM